MSERPPGAKRRRWFRLCVAALGAAASGCGLRPLELATATELARAVESIDAADAEVVVITGDIARCRDLHPAEATASLTAAIVAEFPRTRVLTVGDHAYPRATRGRLARCYASTWGALNARTAPSPGNHDYTRGSAAAFFEYFELYDRNPAAEERGYYAFEVGSWQVVSVNSMLPIRVGSEQIAWLEDVLEESEAACIVAYWHHPRFSSSFHGRQGGDIGRETDALWETLAAHEAELIVNGHAHMYERFAPQTAEGVSATDGIRQFVVGTGGASLDRPLGPLPNSEYLNADVFGVLVLTLGAAAYEWRFIGIDGVVYDESPSPVECN